MSASTVMKASDEVLAILRQAIIDNDGLTLVGKLDRKAYQDVNKFLEAAGAKWNKKAKRHLFTGNSKIEIESLLGTGEIVHKKNLFQSFYTPEDVARKLVELVGVKPGDNCLEPSAGHGAIARHLHRCHANVTCVDIDPQATKALISEGFTTFEIDFLKCDIAMLDGPFDRIVMNPPFTKNQAFQHIIHAHLMLVPNGGTLVSVLPNGKPTGKKLRDDWDNLVATYGEYLEDLPEGTFKESGTSIRTRVIRLWSAS